MPRTKGTPKTTRPIKRQIKITDIETKGRKRTTDITIDKETGTTNVATTSTVKTRTGGRPSQSFMRSVTTDINKID